jgi:hypothetical protein
VHPAVPWSATIVPAWPFPALLAAGVKPSRLYQDHASGKKDDRPGLEACLKSLREADTLIVWKLDRLGRNLRHLVNTIHDLMERKIGFRVLTGQGANIDTTTASGRLVFGIFAALAEFERELIRERTIAGLASARARGRNGGRPYTMTPAKLRLAQAAMAKRDTRPRRRSNPPRPAPSGCRSAAELACEPAFAVSGALFEPRHQAPHVPWLPCPMSGRSWDTARVQRLCDAVPRRYAARP